MSNKSTKTRELSPIISRQPVPPETERSLLSTVSRFCLVVWVLGFGLVHPELLLEKKERKRVIAKLQRCTTQDPALDVHRRGAGNRKGNGKGKSLAYIIQASMQYEELHEFFHFPW